MTTDSIMWPTEAINAYYRSLVTGLACASERAVTLQTTFRFLFAVNGSVLAAGALESLTEK